MLMSVRIIAEISNSSSKETCHIHITNLQLFHIADLDLVPVPRQVRVPPSKCRSAQLKCAPSSHRYRGPRSRCPSHLAAVDRNWAAMDSSRSPAWRRPSPRRRQSLTSQMRMMQRLRRRLGLPKHKTLVCVWRCLSGMLRLQQRREEDEEAEMWCELLQCNCLA